MESASASDLHSESVKIYLGLMSISILLYEYFLTLPLEVDRFWSSSPKCTWASFFFYLNRYLAIFGHFPVLMEYLWTGVGPEKLAICRRLQSYHQYFSIGLQIVVACMLIMRMYALYNRKFWVLLLYFVISVTAVAVGCWSVIGGKDPLKPPEKIFLIGCGTPLTHHKAIRLGGAWAGVMVFDVLVFAMTLYKSLTLPRSRSVHLLTILLRDGSVYFGVMTASNLVNILTFILGDFYTRGAATVFTNIISSVMISRLMLNLRNPSLTLHSRSFRTMASNTALTSRPNVSTMMFTEYSDLMEFESRGPGRPLDLRTIGCQAHTNV